MCHSLYIFTKDYRTTITITYQVNLHLDFNQPWQYSITSCWREKAWLWPTDELSIINHDNICSILHEKCHPKSYHGDIIYHMPLNVILGALNLSAWDILGQSNLDFLNREHTKLTNTAWAILPTTSLSQWVGEGKWKHQADGTCTILYQNPMQFKPLLAQHTYIHKLIN